MKLIAFLTIFLSLAFNTIETPQLLPTKLRVTVIDGLGNFVEGANVSIYEDEKSYLASENPVATLVSDSKGRVTFKELKPMAYFIEANRGDMNNNAEGVKTGILAEGKLNKVNTVIE